MNITVYNRNHFPGAVFDALEVPYHDEDVEYLAQVRVANIIENHDDGYWWAVLYKEGYQYTIVRIDPASLLVEPVPPLPTKTPELIA